MGKACGGGGGGGAPVYGEAPSSVVQLAIMPALPRHEPLALGCAKQGAVRARQWYFRLLFCTKNNVLSRTADDHGCWEVPTNGLPKGRARTRARAPTSGPVLLRLQVAPTPQPRVHVHIQGSGDHGWRRWWRRPRGPAGGEHAPHHPFLLRQEPLLPGLQQRHHRSASTHATGQSLQRGRDNTVHTTCRPRGIAARAATPAPWVPERAR